MISLAEGSRIAFEAAYRARLGVQAQRGEIPGNYKSAVIEAAAGREYSAVPIDLAGLSEFQLKVLKALRRVPRGKVCTYAELALKAGRPGAARAIGNAMARNPVPLLIPCHRVVPSSGGIGNFGLGIWRKRELLNREAARIGGQSLVSPWKG
ncbi:MAG: MGMT family protein [Acidobacteria bacterium]|nr:MGMT family protein [Acidobacteriota bacterium]